MEKQLQDCLTTVPNCVASAAVDLGNGLLLGNAGHLPNINGLDQLLPAAAMSMLAGPDVQAILEAFAGQGPSSRRGGAAPRINKLDFVVGDETTGEIGHYFRRSTKNPSILLVIVCRFPANRPVNLGLLYAGIATAVARLNAAL